MLKKIYLALLPFICFSCTAPWAKTHRVRAVIIKPGFTDSILSTEWKSALVSRMSKEDLDSFASLRRTLTNEEMDWRALFASRTATWGHFLDSLAVPFRGIAMSDSIYLMTGFMGVDDAFTYGPQTVCFDLTAFFKNYGSASLPENVNRADRIFSHEYTHLLHKSWAKKNNLSLVTFKDSVVWECLYEGIGMYRSLSEKYLPKNAPLPELSRIALQELSPVFVEKMNLVAQNASLSGDEKKEVVARLSRGPVDKKWGAFTVAVWLWMEANGDERNLIRWIDKGPEAVILLAKKYLDEDNKQRLSL
jgi:hypothetical protein